MQKDKEVERLAKNHIESDYVRNNLYGRFMQTFKEGYKSNKAEYTEEQMIEAIRYY